MARLCLALREKNVDLAPLEYALSQQMQPWLPTQAGGVNVPLGGDLLFRTPGHEEAIEAFAAELKAYFPPLMIDPDERAWLHQKAFGGKAMTPLDETAGGSLMPPIRRSGHWTLSSGPPRSRGGAVRASSHSGRRGRYRCRGQ